MSDESQTPETDPTLDYDERICAAIGRISIERAIVGGVRGYRICPSNGVSVFYSRLGDALRQQLDCLGHGDDREMMLFGESEDGSAW